MSNAQDYQVDERRINGVAVNITSCRVDEAYYCQAGLPDKPPNHECVISINEGKSDLGDTDPLGIEAGPNRCAVR